MTAPTGWQIPLSTRRWLAEVPADRAVALLLRHSVRDPLTVGDIGYARPINEAGVGLARSFGAGLRGRLKTLHSSPVQRCVHTAEVLGEAAGGGLSVVQDRLLGDPGVFVNDENLARNNWDTLGSEGIMEHLARADHALPGTVHPDAGARALVGHMLAIAADKPGIHLFVTHDILLAITAARFLGYPRGGERWPRYLEGAFFWRDSAGLHAAYRDDCRRGIPEPG